MTLQNVINRQTSEATMIEWLFEPFHRFALDTVGVWYVATVFLMFAVGSLLKYGFGVEPDDTIPDDWSLGQKIAVAVIVAPICEELVFRIAPMWVGMSAGAVIVISVIWALLHGDTALLIVICVPLYVKLALAGMFVELIAVHAFHNLWVALLSHYTGDSASAESDGMDESAESFELPPDEMDDSERLEWIFEKMRNDDDFDPKVRINGTTYDSIDDVPIGEWVDWAEQVEDDQQT